MDLSGKVALVTGGATRVGKAISLGLAQAGADIVVNYYTSVEAAGETVAEIEASGRSALAIQADVSQITQVEAMVRRAVGVFGQIDVLVNNASTFIRAPFFDITETDWDQAMNVDLKGAFLCAQRVAPVMQAHGCGKIINISDLAGLRPWVEYIPHSVAKAGLIMLTQALALALAPTIHVNAVVPGAVLLPEGTPELSVKRIIEATPLQRLGSVEDVVQAVLFLITSDYITGETIVVDGGRILR